MDADTAVPAMTDQDLDLETELNEQIYLLDGVAGTRAEVRVEVRQNHATIYGVVQSPMVAVEIERLVAGTPGILGITNHLIDDATLTRAVAEALATDPRTSSIPPGYEVTSVFGHVAIIAQCSDAMAQQVIAVAQGVPGVRSVNVKTY